MIYVFKIKSYFDKRTIFINQNSNNNNLRFQYELSINYENTDDDFDYGQYWISEKNPINNDASITLYNSFSSGFLNSTGKSIIKNDFIGTSAGTITFIAETYIDKLNFSNSLRNENSVYIRIVKNNIITSNYLSYDIDYGMIYFLNILNPANIPPYLNCEWIIEKLEQNAPIK